MAKKTSKGITIKLALLLIGLVPIVTLAIALSLYSCVNLSNEVKEEVFAKLEVAAQQVNEYFIYDVQANGFIDYEEYADHEYIESGQSLDIEMTVFEKNTRFMTSLKKEDGTYNEGTVAGEGIWEQVSKGENYTSDDTVIGGETYYVCYVPMYNADGTVWGMGFAGTPQAGVKEILRASILQTIIITVILLAVFMTIIVLLARKIYKTLEAPIEALSKLSEGELNISTDNESNIVEISQIAVATEVLKNQLNASVGGAKTTATDLGNAVRSVDGLSAKSASDTESIAHSMEELSVTAQSLAETVQDANGSVIEMGEAITSISAKAETSAANAEDMRSINGQVAGMISNVMTSNEKSVEAIREIGVLTNECKSAVEQIKSAAEEITGIAGQTNLLALNASIESARAGEAGRGFSVVAENIKNLASESAEASAGIGKMVNDIISKVDKCVEAASAAAELMQQQNRLVADAGDSMNRLSDSVGNVADNIAVITDEARRLDEAKNRVLNNISDLSAISEENAASSEQVSASVDEVAGAIEGVKEEAEKMRELAVDLDERMAFFKL